MIEVIIYKTFVMHWIYNLFCPIITTDIILSMKLEDSSYEIDDGPKQLFFMVENADEGLPCSFLASGSVERKPLRMSVLYVLHLIYFHYYSTRC